VLLPKKNLRPAVYWSAIDPSTYIDRTLEAVTGVLYHFGYDIEIDERENGLYVFRKKEVDHAETKEE
jgi:hypothetical protein